MSGKATQGDCYLCGEAFSKAGYKKHVLTAHKCEDGETQDCLLIKVEAVYEKAYWLYLDISMASTLKTLDKFLRDIWLECCGHMSVFSTDDGWELSMSKLVCTLPKGTKLNYEYDFGSSTELTVTVMDYITRPKQRKAVRLLARNQPLSFACGQCGQNAAYICCECEMEDENPFFCAECAERHESVHDYLLPVANSPRMGVCSYSGEYDTYTFLPDRFKKA
ncbi:MAG: plasmid pRiA4b ORF-3 family protein [Oscillospiraceae bacterium]|nr:plasmid pRiA4b ORF-3 family protein [Oscillospiraceae bacterium]